MDLLRSKSRHRVVDPTSLEVVARADLYQDLPNLDIQLTVPEARSVLPLFVFVTVVGLAIAPVLVLGREQVTEDADEDAPVAL